MSALLSADDVRRAINTTAPMIEHLLRESWSGGTALHLIVAKRHPSGVGGFEILDQQSFGESKELGLYAQIASSKAALTARTGLSSREVQTMRPELLVPGDTIYWGSAIQGDIIVAASGVHSYFDEFAATTVLALCMALITQKCTVLKDQATGSWYSSQA